MTIVAGSCRGLHTSIYAQSKEHCKSIDTTEEIASSPQPNAPTEPERAVMYVDALDHISIVNLNRRSRSDRGELNRGHSSTSSVRHIAEVEGVYSRQRG